MTIRSTIFLLSLPLFLALAGINGLLLVRQESVELARALDDRAMAAAVTVAEFAASMNDPVARFSQPRLAAAMKAAAADIDGLEGLYIVGPDGGATPLVPSRGRPGNFRPPRAAIALPIGTGSSGHRAVTALAPASGGHFIVARIDAEPMFGRIATLERSLLLLIVAAGVIGTMLAWFVARRLTYELRQNHTMIDAICADADASAPDNLTIRETRDLGHAVHLIRASMAATEQRGHRERTRRDQVRDELSSVTAYRDAAFTPLAATAAGMKVAVRMLGEAPAGSFFALCVQPDRAALVLGECVGDAPATALARALSARRFFEERLFAGSPDDNIALGREAFDIDRLAWLEWTEAGAATAAIRTLALLDGREAERAAIYAQRCADLDPTALLDDLALLLTARGPIAALRGTPSAERCEG